MSFDFSTLITDRRKSDADYARVLIGRITDGTATTEELAEWNAATLKGVYDYTDLNRVTAAMDEINRMLSAAGYKTGYQPVEVHPSDIDQKTLLLLHGDELKDSSIYALPLTNSGVQVSTVQSRFGGKSLYFNGAGFLTTSSIDISQSDFTIDWWEYVLGEPAARFSFGYPTDNQGFLVSWKTGGSFAGKTANQWDIFMEQPITDEVKNTWVHRAIVKKESQWKSYKNGVEFWKGSYPDGPYANPNGKFALGTYSTANPTLFYGYIDEFRISNVARWSSNFSPPDHAYGLSEKEPYTWYESDNPTLPQLAQYLENVRALRSAIANQSPDVPGLKDMFSVEAANNIEKILLSIQCAIRIMKQTYVPCGATACGGDYL